VLSEDIVFEEAYFLCPIWKNHNSQAILDSFGPVSLVDGAINPPHLSISFSKVELVTSSVLVPALPSIFTITVLLVILVVSVIAVACHSFHSLFLPLALPMLETINEHPSIGVAIGPLVLPETVRIPILVLSNKLVLIGKDIETIPMTKAGLPLSFIAITVLPYMDSKAFRLAIHPLPYE